MRHPDASLQQTLLADPTSSGLDGTVRSDGPVAAKLSGQWGGGMAEIMRTASGTGYSRDDSAVVVQFPDPSASMSVTGRTGPRTWTPGAASRA